PRLLSYLWLQRLPSSSGAATACLRDRVFVIAYELSHAPAPALGTPAKVTALTGHEAAGNAAGSHCSRVVLHDAHSSHFPDLVGPVGKSMSNEAPFKRDARTKIVVIARTTS